MCQQPASALSGVAGAILRRATAVSSSTLHLRCLGQLVNHISLEGSFGVQLGSGSEPNVSFGFRRARPPGYFVEAIKGGTFDFAQVLPEEASFKKKLWIQLTPLSGAPKRIFRIS